MIENLQELNSRRPVVLSPYPSPLDAASNSLLPKYRRFLVFFAPTGRVPHLLAFDQSSSSNAVLVEQLWSPVLPNVQEAQN